MVDSGDIGKTILIFIIFILLYASNIWYVGIKQIKDDWPTYRCNPAYMPFASMFGHDTGENFTYCMQNMQSNYMETLLQPLNYNMGVQADMGTNLSGGLNGVRAFFDKMRNYTTSIVGNIFGVFLNLLIEVQRIIINIKDLFGKLVGIMTTLMYTLEGAMMTMESTWAGPPGQLTRALCFHPATKLRLKDGTLKPISEIPLNSVLKTGCQVYAVMQISNLDSAGRIVEPLYKILGGEEAAEPILVSGSHLVYAPDRNQFIPVKELPKALLAEQTSEYFTCLITSDHTIPIGEWIFHDWEDNNGSAAKNILFF
jgi:hypothetical protein